MSNKKTVWPKEARLALSIVVNVEEGSEYSVLDGDRGPDPVDELGLALKKPVRNYGNESNYRYGIVEGAPRVLELLDRYNFPATFTAAAVSLERAESLALGLRNSQHEVCSHGYRWIHQHRLSEQEERQFIQQAIDSITKTVGRRPMGWLSRYLITDNTRRLLQDAGFLYHMDDYSQDQPFWCEVNGSDKPIVIMPYAIDSNDMKMWTAPSLTPDAWLKYAIDTFDWLYAEGEAQTRMMSLGLHLRIIGRPGRIGALRSFLDYVSKKEDAWVTTRESIATTFARQNSLPQASKKTEEALEAIG